MQDLKSITILLPAYNEEKNIAKAVLSSLDTLKDLTPDYEVLVVNDGSSDRTGEIADELGRADNHVRVVHNPRNMGVGPSLKIGFMEARCDLIFFAPADNQQDISELRLFLPLAKEADIVAGYRIKRHDPLHRHINSRLWNALVRISFGVKVQDIDWVKLYKRQAIQSIAAQLESRSAFLDAEILIRAKKRGYRIREVGVRHYPRQFGRPSGNRPGVVFRAFRDYFRLYWKLR